MTQETSHCPLWFSLTHPAPLGLDAMVQTWLRLHLYGFQYPYRSAPGSSGESAPGRGPSTASSPILAGPSMVLGPDFLPRRLSIGDSRQEESSLTGGGHYRPPSPGAVEAVGVASEGAQLIAPGLSTEVVETILQSRAPSMRKMYTLNWKLFTSWCGDHQLDPVKLPSWYSAGVPAGPILRRVDPIHHEGLRGGHCGLPRPSRWPVSGQEPPSYTFPPWCAEAEAYGTILCPSVGPGFL